MPDMLENLYPYFKGSNPNLKIMSTRLGNLEMPSYYDQSLSSLNLMANQLQSKGGYGQQDRMIRDKRRSLDKAMLYSYQAAWIKRQIYDFEETMDGEKEAPPVRALINPNKVKADYDEKVLSTGFENNFQTGDVFEWCNTNSYWLIYLQDLTELAYFRADIRRCRYSVAWNDEDGNPQQTYMALRGPVETKIEYIQKNGTSIDRPNYSLNFLLPKTTANLKKFKRYSKFYLQDLVEGEDKVCWRVEAVNTLSTPGIIEVTAVEYYANALNDDIENGIVDGLIITPVVVNETDNTNFEIFGDTFIKPKKEYTYYIYNSKLGKWHFNAQLPVIYKEFQNDEGYNSITIKWDSPLSGQFDIWFGSDKLEAAEYKKTIVVESLF